MSVNLIKVAEPYAQALFDLAKSSNSLNEITEDLDLVFTFVENSSFKKFIVNPSITTDTKKNFIKSLFREKN